MSRSDFVSILNQIYGEKVASIVEPNLQRLVDHYRGQIPMPAVSILTQQDSFLITYGDQLQEINKPPLQSLNEFCETWLKGKISGIHILPFFPWSSDDGFSVKDYRSVDAKLGDWEDIERLGNAFRLMIDAVINHASSQGDWFQRFLQNEAPYRDYFLTVQGNPDLSKVVRPRVLPLLTEFQTSTGSRAVWTTFSADQVDLDFHNPDVLLEIIDILLMYTMHGAQFIRLDAIAYLWKEFGTGCIHLPQTHAVIQLLRSVLNEVAPHVRIITETNVPHRENLSYFGNGTNEAQLIYNFALPPLVLHTFCSGDASKLSAWAAGLTLPSDQTTFFNFLASHDGIGLNPAREILSPVEIDALVSQTLSHDGLISFKQNPDGTQSPYELNINYFDALSNPSGHEPIELQINRFMTAQAIMLSLQGVPGIYFHSLFGSRGWKSGVKITGHNRSINREKIRRSLLKDELDQPSSLRAVVYRRYCNLLARRFENPAFHPNGGQQVLNFGAGIFAIKRFSQDGKRECLCLHNVTNQVQSTGNFRLEPYQTIWVEGIP
jgi:glycosidase